MDIYFLSKQFYDEHPQEKYPQMEIKKDRPYGHIKLSINNINFYVPLRSNINHPHVFWTDKKNRCGVDFSKVVIIEDDDYIDYKTKVFLRSNEYKKLQGKDFRIKKGFLNYLKTYISACDGDKTINHREDILKYSTLQYYESYISILRELIK